VCCPSVTPPQSRASDKGRDSASEALRLASTKGTLERRGIVAQTLPTILLPSKHVPSRSSACHPVVAL
jgi:hypothetical protein